MGTALGALLEAAEVDASKLPPPASRAVDFARDIKPIFEANCFSCHGPQKQKSQFRLDRKSDALKGGDSHAPDIVPGKSAESPLIHFVAGLVPDMKMPAKGDPLTREQIALLRAWIDQGANWPDDSGDARKMHWAFQPVKRPTAPKIQDSGFRIQNPVDAFVAAKLKEKKLASSPEADRRTLIRRLSFDVIGLPPTPEEVEAFVADKSPQAYENLVERLLASPHFGERWARHWLDVVRFAESHGFEMNRMRPNAWPYRDYVIRAFNEDKPYDQFVREQLAGDALGADEATGFIVGGPWDQVKSPDPVLTAQQRADELHDMVGTTGATFLGLTVNCARCHNHKFDPISTQDYYSMVACFAGVQHGDHPLKTADDQERKAKAEQVRAELALINKQLERFEPPAQTGTNAPARWRPPVNARLNVERVAPVEARFIRFTVFATSDNNRYEPCLDELEVWTNEETPRNVSLASAGAKATSSGNYPGNTKHTLEHLNDGIYGNDHSWISNERGKGWVQLEFAQKFTISKIVWGRDREEKFKDRLAVNYRIEAATAPGAWRVIASSEDRKPFAPEAKPEPAYASEGLSPADAAELQRLLTEQQSLSARLKELTAAPAVYAGMFVKPGETFRLHRGDVTQKREPVAPGALAEFGAKMQLPADAPEQERRLVLAKWITDPRHPLTARVIVNRLWHYHFGTGIVDTPSDFGINGGRPTHPELLDWLASELVASGWKLKHIHRLILLSATYRQSGVVNEKALHVDAASRLLWRFPPRRLEAEPLRDAILAVSGKLDLRLGGPGFDLFVPNDNYVKVYKPKTEFGPAEFRRMVYQSKPRVELDDVFGAFDCPDAGQIAPKRTSSTTPLQALNLLNSAFTLQQAGYFAERVEHEAGTNAEAQTKRAFQLAFGRAPSKEEITASAKLIREHGLLVLCRALFNANEFVVVF